ncbi:uncharacterized protein A4U43_C10F16470 [Asparagus officinalis]|uniref:Agenet domain-containing protein n=1 Tax=Asparagus officinalis TaxID=4686 RepID=A0A5P1E828_ASPOF|nr:uncharacterized protein LOC109825193 isoform X2 [Asparagus officinalis]ONK57086.1 uncharacterized protein A4U43_C10F16470 [Asparagus officinalis]
MSRETPSWTPFTALRPASPRRLGRRGGVRGHQLVEAFHNDGWWRGVVSEVVKGKRGVFRVSFPSSREEFEFKGKELRELREWVKGNWVAVKDQEVEEKNVMFDVGSRIEVSRDKENYGASWYVGTVLKVIGAGFFLVEYENLRIDSSGSNGMPLKEIVDLQYIRPSPPPQTVFDNFVDILEEVEAFRKGGWVAGVVSKLLCGSRYVFKPKHWEEEIELDWTAIRPHFDWTNGRWVRISREKSSKRPSSGETRTYNLHETRTYSRRQKSRFVELSNLPISMPTFSDNGGEVAGRSAVLDLKAKKPGEPTAEGGIETSQTFKKLRKGPEEHLKAKKSKEPTVEGGIETSQTCKKVKEGIMPEEHLKVIDETKSVAHRCIERSRTRKHSTLSIAMLSRINRYKTTERIAAMHLKDKKIKGSSFKERIKSSQPCNNPKKGKSSEERMRSVDSILKNCCTKTKRVVGKRSSAGPTPGDTEIPSHWKIGKKSMELIHEQDISKMSGWGSHKARHVKTKNTKMERNTKMKRDELVLQSADCKRKTPDVIDVEQQDKMKKRRVGRPPKKKITSKKGMGSTQPEEGEEIVGREDRREFVELSKNCPLSANREGKKSANDTNICLYNMQEDIMEHSPESHQLDSSNVVANLLKDSTTQDLSKLKSFNSRIAECDAEEPRQAFPFDEDDVHNHDDLIPNGSKEAVEMERSLADHTPDGLSLLKEYNACDQTSNACDQTSNACDQTSLSEKVSGEMDVRTPADHSPNASSLSREEHVPDHGDFTSSESLMEKIVIEMEKTSNDPAHLREDIHFHDHLTSSGLPSEKAITEAEGRLDVYPICSMSPHSSVALPFVKESAMWETVESMEVFHTTPQQPHFHPLKQYEVEYREGMAIGLMVTFANLVSSIQKLRITDSEDIFEEKLKVLISLESHGFNIQFARSCLEKLLQIRSNVSHSQGKKVSLKEKILEAEDEKDQLEEFIAAHDKIILDLEENLYRYKERRSSMISGRNKKDSEIVQLKMNLQATEEAFSSAEENFNAVARSMVNVT